MPAHDPHSPFISWLNGMSRAYGYPRDADLARALGLPQSTLSRWRRGTRPSVEHLAKVSTLFRTDLKALLALTGHITADTATDPLAVPPPPPSPVTETVRRIRDAEIPDAMREVLFEYWDRRLREERGRLYSMLKELTDPRSLSEADVKQWLQKLFETDFAQHVSDVFIEIIKYAAGSDSDPQAKRRPSARGEQAQAADEGEP